MSDIRPDLYRGGLIPRANRFPKRRRHWLRLGLIVALLAAVLIGGTWQRPRIAAAARIHCRTGLVSSSDVWQQSSGPAVPGFPTTPECVGLSEGPYDFGLPAFAPVFRVIAHQNQVAASSSCAKNGGAPVTIGVPITLTSPNTGGRARHELEGFAAAQALANSSLECTRPVRLRVGQIGANGQAAVADAKRLASSSAVVGMVGMGLSSATSAQAVTAVAGGARPVPMVADLITAEGFDRDGSAADHPDFRQCTGAGAYEHGIGDGYFYRVSFRSAVQVQALARYIPHGGGQTDFIVTPSTSTDPSTCTEFSHYAKLFPKATQIPFDIDEPSTIDIAVRQLCAVSGPITVMYAARGRDLSRFIVAIDTARQHNECSPSGITLVESSDGARIRAVDTDRQREALRRAALQAPAFRSGYLRVILTPLANRDRLGGVTLTRFGQEFSALGFDPTDLDDGWALNASDALTTMTAALQTIPLKLDGSPLTVTPGLMNVTIHGFNGSSTAATVPGALQGPLAFDNEGNRIGGAKDRLGATPVPVRICPDSVDPARVATYPAGPLPGACPTGG